MKCVESNMMKLYVQTNNFNTVSVEKAMSDVCWMLKVISVLSAYEAHNGSVEYVESNEWSLVYVECNDWRLLLFWIDVSGCPAHTWQIELVCLCVCVCKLGVGGADDLREIQPVCFSFKPKQIIL